MTDDTLCAAGPHERGRDHFGRDRPPTLGTDRQVQRLNVFGTWSRSTFSPSPRIDEKRQAGSRSARWPTPRGIKDVVCVEGEPTTCGSRMLRTFRHRTSRR